MDCSPMLIAAASEMDHWGKTRTHHAQHIIIDCLVLPHAQSMFSIDISADAEADWHGESTVSLADAFLNLHSLEVD